jgi:hypothetical protein
MTSENKEQFLIYGLISILNLKYIYNLPIKKFDSEKIKEIVNYRVKPGIHLRLDRDNIIIRVDVQAVIKDTDEMVMNIITDFAFHVPELNKHMEQREKDGNKYMAFKKPINNGLYTLLIGVSYSTMRGILTEKVKGTPLDTTFLPVVDPHIFQINYEKIN